MDGMFVYRIIEIHLIIIRGPQCGVKQGLWVDKPATSSSLSTREYHSSEQLLVPLANVTQLQIGDEIFTITSEEITSGQIHKINT